ncbi:MAG: response regulator [Pseudomonadota bacterium]
MTDLTAKGTILIVDDEPFNVDLLEQELSFLGYETQAACNGQEALNKVAASPPDLILLDVMMPVLDGFAVCGRLKADADTALIPIIIMTALDGFEDRIKGIEAGADDFLTKPVNERELTARIATALRTKKAMDNKIGRLAKIQDHFEKFVPETVKHLVRKNPEAPELGIRESDISVLFLDISGYTRLCETVEASQLNQTVEQYFSAFLDVIHDAGGDVSNTAGDALMVIFQSSEGAWHARTAVDTGLDLLRTTQSLNAHSTLEPLGVHLGINSGPALVGSTRYEGKRGARWVFTANGSVINLAARLAGVAQNGDLVIGPETARRLGPDYDLRPSGHQKLKNIAEPVLVQKVLTGPN